MDVDVDEWVASSLVVDRLLGTELLPMLRCAIVDDDDGEGELNKGSERNKDDDFWH